MVDREKLERELDKGSMSELPENIPPGFLGEVSPDMRKADESRHGMNAGVIQESTSQTRWLMLLLLYLLVFTAPVALWLLWAEPRRSVRVKVMTTLAGLAGYIALAYWIRW